MTKIEMQAMDAVIGIHREMKKANEINWEQRRYEIAKSIASVMWLDDGQAERAEANRGGIGFEYKSDELIAKEAVTFADALIAELKKEKE